MATEKILIFDEAGNAKRMKVRIARFLDNEPVTASDKTNIRTTLDVDDSLSGTFTTPLSVTSASDSSFTGGGNVGIGTSSPGSYNSKADNLVVGSESGDNGITILTGTGNDGSLYFADSTGGNNRGIVAYNHVAENLQLGAGGGVRAKIWDGGDLEVMLGNLKFATAGKGIDFGSTNTNTGVTVTGSVMSEYESGTWTPTYTTTSSGFTTPPTMDVISARYVRIGDLVTFFADIRTDSVDLTGAGTYLLVNGLPYAATVSSGGNNVAVNIGYATAWANAPAGGYVQGGQTYIYLTKRVSSITGNLSEMSPSDLTAGTVANQNTLMISGSYYTNA